MKSKRQATRYKILKLIVAGLKFRVQEFNRLEIDEDVTTFDVKNSIRAEVQSERREIEQLVIDWGYDVDDFDEWQRIQ